MDFIYNILSVYGIEIISACLVSAICFLGLIAYLSKHSKKKTGLLKWSFIIMFIVGMIMYCFCHYASIGQVLNGQLVNKRLDWVKSESASWFSYILYVVMMSLIDVGTMFYGRANSEVFYNLPLSHNEWFVFIFWFVHVLAFFMAAGAVLIKFGDKFLRWFRLKIAKLLSRDIDLIYGINENSVVFGRNIADRKGTMLIYVDKIVREEYESLVRDMGGIIYSGNNVSNVTESFLKEIGLKPNKNKLRLYALYGEFDKNLRYAQRMLASLKELNIQPEQTELILLGTDEWKGMFFQDNPEEHRYGFGKVISFDECEMNAHLLIYKYPLCDAIKFDNDGKAVEDMYVLIVGFGRIGHEVLRKVVANGQFEGSKFHAVIYDPDFDRRDGFVKSQYHLMFDKRNYDIRFEPRDGRSSEIFKFIEDNASKLKYIVICLENRETARYMAIRMVDRLHSMGYPQNVYTCDSRSVRCYSNDVSQCATDWIYDSDLLYSDRLDKYAMELNHVYNAYKGHTLAEDWKNALYLDRMSSRAAVDYLMSLISRIKSVTNTDTLTQEQIENLAKSEHSRWCAFHHSFGFEAMTKEEFAQRVEARHNGHSNIKPTKDLEKRKHVCLVSWDELDEISRIENSITGGNADYKNNDFLNIDTVMKLMQDVDSTQQNESE